MRRAALLVLAGFALASPASAQSEDPAEVPMASGGAVSCSELNNRAMEASLVIRQHASALSAGFEPDARPQAMVMLAWLDQWTGRLQGLVDVAEFSSCLDDGDAESYRRALAMAARVANTAREELLRPGRSAAQPQRRR
ncbi:hypothetical protein KPL78_24685 [Roseomonas sp. HJA6]|uniref:UrcA family protein n=1 Tax=Roseomonas alba TaxID=2846776 RepID=A0ABS7AFK3_9PROT|nr:hypothetical protein [Neoroseomonas alba]MBW6401079.1 hypothetical protein [Neoroseomonas alba]